MQCQLAGGAFVEAADEMEQQLSAALREGQIAEFVESDEVHACQVIGKVALTVCTGLCLEPVDEIEHIEEAAARAGADATAGDRGQPSLRGPGFMLVDRRAERESWCGLRSWSGLCSRP